MMIRTITVLLSLFVVGCAPPRLASVTAAASDGAVVFRDISVFDGDVLLEHQDVTVRGDSIQAVAPAGERPVPNAAVQISGAGRTLLPGLIDSHMHLFSAGEKAGRTPQPEAIAGAFLYAGVTTALVAAGFGEAAALRKEAADANRPLPRFFTAGPGLTAPGGHPIPLLEAMLPWPISALAIRGVRTAEGAEDARAKVQQVVADEAPEFFKVTFDDLPPGSPHLSTDALRAALDEVRRRGLRAIVHATTPDDAMKAIDAGAAALAHVPQRGQLTDDQVERIRAAGVPVITTVRLVSATHELAQRGPTALDREMFDATLLAPWRTEPAWNLKGFSEEFDRNQREVADITQTNFRRLLAGGVPLLVGTDSGVHGVFPGASLHHELRLLVELGMPTLDALRAATSRPAAFLAPGGGFGRVASGQRADLLLVRGNPVEDIQAISAIDEVFVGGVRLQRNKVP